MVFLNTIKRHPFTEYKCNALDASNISDLKKNVILQPLRFYQRKINISVSFPRPTNFDLKVPKCKGPLAHPIRQEGLEQTLQMPAKTLSSTNCQKWRRRAARDSA